MGRLSLEAEEALQTFWNKADADIREPLYRLLYHSARQQEL
jgi:hypothetical protein